MILFSMTVFRLCGLGALPRADRHQRRDMRSLGCDDRHDVIAFARIQSRAEAVCLGEALFARRRRVIAFR